MPAVTYLSLDFSIAIAVGAFFLFLKDIQDWMEARRTAAAQAQNGMVVSGTAEKMADYERLKEEEAEEEEEELGSDESPAIKSAMELTKELRYLTDRCEELDIKTKVNRKAKDSKSVAMREELHQLTERRDELRRIVNGKQAAKVEVATPGVSAEEGQAKAAAEAAAKKAKANPAKGSGAGKEAAGMLVKLLKGPVAQVGRSVCLPSPFLGSARL